MRKRKLAKQITSLGLAFVIAMGGLSNITFAAATDVDNTKIVLDEIPETSAIEILDYDALNDEIYGNIEDYPVGDLEDSGEIIEGAISVGSADEYNQLITEDIPQVLKDFFPTIGTAPTTLDSVDHSTNENAIYLPPVLNQYGGSCTCYSYIYAMGSYIINKARGTSAQETNNVINPLFSYNTSRGTLSGGASPKNALANLKQIGVPTAEYAPITNKYENYSYTWYPTEEIWNSAADNRIEEIIHLEDISHTGTPVTSVDDSDLDLIKSTLASGKIIGFSTYLYTFNYTVIPEGSPSHAGEHVVDRCDYVRKDAKGKRSVGGHAMALVGYDDNIWVDINRDGQKQEGEFGALKIMNSHGTGYKNKGFVWVAYDAINKVSSVLTDADAQRINAAIDAKTMTGAKVSSADRYEFFTYKNYLYTITATSEAKTSSGCRLVATLNTNDRQDANMEIVATKKGSSTTYKYKVPMFNSYGKWSKQYALDGSQNATDGTIVIDLDNVVPDITPATMDDYTWSVTVKDNKSGSVPLNVNDLHIKVDGVKKYNADLTTSSLNASSATYTLNEYVPGNITTIYYDNSSFTNAYIHYRVDNGKWTSVPGKKMATSSEQSGYKWKFEIDLGKQTGLEICFNDGNNSWDSNGEENYLVGIGTFGIKDRTITEINVSKEFAVTLSSDKSIGTKGVSTTFTAQATNGKAPYIYQFAMVEAGKTPISSSYTAADAKNTYSYTSQAAGNFTLYVKVTDAEGKTIEAARSYRVVENNVSNTTKLTIYYSNSSWTQAYIHYKVGSGSWTSVPGVKMSNNTSDNGYTWKYEFDLGTASNATMCFNDGNGSWDNNSSKDYSITGAGSYGIKSGNKVKLEEMEEVEDETIVVLDKTSVTVDVGGNAIVAANIWPVETADKTVTWTTADESVATVSDGVITGVAAGKTTITATLSNGVKATVEVTVNASIVKELEGTAEASKTTVTSGDKITFTATASGGTGSYKYSFIVHNKTTNKWARIVDKGTSNSYTWKAGTSGKRIFYVDITDESGKTVRTEGITVITENANGLKVTGMATVNSVSLGGKTTIKATASGGTSPYTYSFVVYNKDTKKWYRYSFRDSNTLNWTATSKGTRVFYVEVKDAKGNVVRGEGITITVK